MQTQELQKECSDLVRTLDDRFGIERDPQLSFTQLIEEVGELAKDINLPRLRNKEIDAGNLSGEFADVFIQLCALAQLHGIDIEKATAEKMAIIRNRHGLQ
jgi:NTP pyrophosphatase (non-canonical NTP hydrolase)